MENRQRTIRKLLWRITAVLAVLAVVSICFVSGTFARYVTKKSGSTTTDVAKWDIDFMYQNQELKTSTFALVNKLSPSMADFPTVGSGGTVTNRVNSSGTVLVLKIENKGDVDAELVITPPADDTLTFYGYDTDGKTHATTEYEGWGDDGFEMTDGLVSEKPTLAEAQAVITMQFALTTHEITGDNEDDWQSLSDFNFNLEQNQFILKAAPQEGETQTEGTSVYYFYVRSVWTSQDQEGADYADALDTWLGENIAALGGEFTFAAIQASEWPTTP